VPNLHYGRNAGILYDIDGSMKPDSCTPWLDKPLTRSAIDEYNRPQVAIDSDFGGAGDCDMSRESYGVKETRLVWRTCHPNARDAYRMPRLLDLQLPFLRVKIECTMFARPNVSPTTITTSKLNEVRETKPKLCAYYHPPIHPHPRTLRLLFQS